MLGVRNSKCVFYERAYSEETKSSTSDNGRLQYRPINNIAGLSQRRHSATITPYCELAALFVARADASAKRNPSFEPTTRKSHNVRLHSPENNANWRIFANHKSSRLVSNLQSYVAGWSVLRDGQLHCMNPRYSRNYHSQFMSNQVTNPQWATRPPRQITTSVLDFVLVVGAALVISALSNR